MTYSVSPSSLLTEYGNDNICRVLALDGGGAKGFYTLGVLKEIEAMLGCPLYKRFDLVFGTSTGAIIAALIALGYEVDQICPAGRLRQEQWRSRIWLRKFFKTRHSKMF